jgi:ABC-type amino acid transport substrate-binding protein
MTKAMTILREGGIILMKRRILVMLICSVLTLLSFATFVDAAKPAGEEKAKSIGMLEMNYTKAQTIETDAQKQINRNRAIKYYNNLGSMIQDLRNGKLDRVSLPEFTVDFIRGRDPEGPIILSVQDRARYFVSFSMATYNNPALTKKLNTALDSMKKDGTLDKLVKLYVTGLPGDVEPPVEAIPTIAGAETIKVVVTGDFPPVDYINAQGVPAGFSNVFMKEIAKRAQLNVQFVRADEKTDIAKLQKREGDVLLCYRVNTVVDNLTILSNYDKVQDKALEITQPYIETPVRLIKLNKGK